MTTPHVQSFVLISMLRGPPNTPPSGDDLAVLDYHLNAAGEREDYHERIQITYSVVASQGTHSKRSAIYLEK